MEKCIFALGFFDGVHLGHQALLGQCRVLAREAGVQAGAVTFSVHPQSLVRGQAPGLINTLRDRQALLARFGMEQVRVLPFDGRMQAMSWQEFVRELVTGLGARGFVCGEDFRFGAGGRGNAALLAQLCREKGLLFAAVPEQSLDGERISSSRIRALLEAGRVAEAARLLGHPHILTGTVIPGRQLGRTLGIPTANLAQPEGVQPLGRGVYACHALVEGRRFAAVTNVGVRPTVSGEGLTIEPWLLEYTGDLYGKELSLEFVEFLRPEERFRDLECLKNAIRADAERAKKLLDGG